MTIHKTFFVESKAIDAEQGIYEAMVSTESIDRDDDILLAEGCDVTNYLKNPLVLWGHNYWTPDAVVARALDVVKIPGRGVKLTFQFVTRGVNATADLVHDLWAGGYLRAMSVGFIPKLREARQDMAGNELRSGFLYRVWELLEGSIVTIPANQDALALAFDAMKAKGYDEQQLRGVLFEQKRGRVLNAKNEERIRQAEALLQEVISTLGGDADADAEQEAASNIQNKAPDQGETKAYNAEETAPVLPDVEVAGEQPGDGSEEPNTDDAMHDASKAMPEPVANALSQYFTQIKNILTEVHHE